MAICALVLILGRSSFVRTQDHAISTLPAEVHVKAVERKTEPVGQRVDSDASSAVAIVCGMDAATADRYEARNDALRSIARRRDLSEYDVAALMAYLRRADDALRIERVAALKNDVMNLLRNQESPVEGLAETLMGMIDGTPSLPARSRDTVADGTATLPDGGVRGAVPPDIENLVGGKNCGFATRS